MPIFEVSLTHLEIEAATPEKAAEKLRDMVMAGDTLLWDVSEEGSGEFIEQFELQGEAS